MIIYILTLIIILLLSIDFNLTSFLFEIKFFKTTFSLKIRESENFQYKSLKKLVISCYFLKINVFENEVFIYTRREIHVIDRLRVNILIKNDFINLKETFIDIVN